MQDISKHLKRWDLDMTENKRCFGTKICLSGAEQISVREGLFRVGVKRIQINFFYLKSWLKKNSVQSLAEDFARFDYIIIDSGYEQFCADYKDNKTSAKYKKSVVDFCISYYALLKSVGHLFSACIDVPLSKQDDPLIAEKRREVVNKCTLLPVLEESDLELFKDICKHSFYIAISKKLQAPKYTNFFNKMLEHARENNILLHGLSVTSVEVIARNPFYSLSSSSWLNGSKYGTTMIFHNGKICQYDNKNKKMRSQFKNRFEENGLIWSLIENDTKSEVDLMNALAWSQYSDYVQYSVGKSYWLSAEDKDLALSVASHAFDANGLIDRKASLLRTQSRRLSQISDADQDDRAHEYVYCNLCRVAGKCPRFKKDQPCGYDINVRLETKRDIQKAVQVLLEIAYGRIMTASLIEKLEGGTLDESVSKELERFFGLLKQSKGIFDIRPEGEELVIKAKSSNPNGAVSNMLASVFSSTGSNGSGSGLSIPQRMLRAEAKKIEDDDDEE